MTTAPAQARADLSKPFTREPVRPGAVDADQWHIAHVYEVQIRLKRLVPKGIFKADLGQLVIPVKGGRNVATELVELLSTLFPAKEAAA